MRRFMVHLLNKSHSSRDATQLLYRARSLIEREGLVVRDARVSKRYIEYDLSIPSGLDVQEEIMKLEAISPLGSYEEVVERHLPKNDAIRLAVESFNEEKYWNAHEILEAVWKNAEGAEKGVLNGIILVAAAFVHDQKDESDICLSILKRALSKLEVWHGDYYGIDVDRLASGVAEILNSGRIVRFTI